MRISHPLQRQHHIALELQCLTITQSGGDTIISVNGETDTITLENVTTLINASDFIF